MPGRCRSGDSAFREALAVPPAALVLKSTVLPENPAASKSTRAPANSAPLNDTAAAVKPRSRPRQLWALSALMVNGITSTRARRRWRPSRTAAPPGSWRFASRTSQPVDAAAGVR